jgi:hypothetical protein
MPRQFRECYERGERKKNLPRDKQVDEDFLHAFDRIDKNEMWTRILTAVNIAQWGLILILIQKILG